jgi:hypothetical protein
VIIPLRSNNLLGVIGGDNNLDTFLKREFLLYGVLRASNEALMVHAKGMLGDFWFFAVKGFLNEGLFLRFFSFNGRLSCRSLEGLLVHYKSCNVIVWGLNLTLEHLRNIGADRGD